MPQTHPYLRRLFVALASRGAGSTRRRAVGNPFPCVAAILRQLRSCKYDTRGGYAMGTVWLSRPCD